ncbi:MAG: hypothetical protein AAF702_11095 [Chloroflexota bacterium]
MNRSKPLQISFWEPLALGLCNVLIGGFVHEPMARMGVLALLVVGWGLYCWWSRRNSYKLYLYTLIGLALFGLLMWINPLLPWWIFTAGVTVGAVTLFLVIHLKVWELLR